LQPHQLPLRRPAIRPAGIRPMLSVPFDAVTLQAIVDEPGTPRLVSYQKSSLKGKAFLAYLSALRLNVYLDLSDTTEDELKALLAHHMRSESILHCYELVNLQALVILRFLKHDIAQYLEGEFPTLAFFDSFVEEHSTLLASYVMFLSSLYSF